MNQGSSLFLELLQVALGSRDCLSRVPANRDWQHIDVEAQHQAVFGMIVQGIERLPIEQRPPKELLFQWIGVEQMIEQQNRVLNKRCVELQTMFAEGGFKTCILKGQGNARMYPNPLMRQSGDIDLWVDGSREDITRFVQTQSPTAKEKFKDIDFTYKDVEVEVHYMPGYLNGFGVNRRYQAYVSEQRPNQFAHFVVIGEGQEICAPTDVFNILYQMAHLYHHFFCEGIGIRHFVDYYYLLKNSERSNIEIVEATELLSEFGMRKFAKGVMWVLKEKLGLEENYLLMDADERIGQKIWKEMIRYGNFGNTVRSGQTALSAKWTNTIKPLRYLWSFPKESVDRLMFVVWLQAWKIRHKKNE